MLLCEGRACLIRTRDVGRTSYKRGDAFILSKLPSANNETKSENENYFRDNKMRLNETSKSDDEIQTSEFRR